MQYQNNPQRYSGTSGAGFTDSHLADHLINPDKVTMYDNHNSGRKEFLERYVSNPNFHFIQADLLNFATLNKAIANHDVIFHLAGNPDVRAGIINTKRALQRGTLATHNVLEVMKVNQLGKVASRRATEML
jgi:nucleoside-diphosphate-sugar epimerase